MAGAVFTHGDTVNRLGRLYGAPIVGDDDKLSVEAEFPKNVARFRDVLRELSLDTQFIVSTHNRGTVQAAQTIYGITMGEDSASQMSAIRPEEYVTQGELL